MANFTQKIVDGILHRSCYEIMKTTFANKVIAFNQSLFFSGTLPAGIRIMNPFKENRYALEVSSAFYKKYYDDNNPRQLILGINPGRFGGGVTGVPFTDSKRLKSGCGIAWPEKDTHEPSSAFIYDMINAYGGPDKFYGRFYIHSICPLGFTSARDNGKEVNYNYYDSAALFNAVKAFMVESTLQQLNFGINKKTVFCLGTGKNEKFISKLNEQHHFFETLIPLEHPRFIMQYKAKQKEQYIKKYLDAFNEVRT